LAFLSSHFWQLIKSAIPGVEDSCGITTKGLLEEVAEVLVTSGNRVGITIFT